MPFSRSHCRIPPILSSSLILFKFLIRSECLNMSRTARLLPTKDSSIQAPVAAPAAGPAHHTSSRLRYLPTRPAVSHLFTLIAFYITLSFTSPAFSCVVAHLTFALFNFVQFHIHHVSSTSTVDTASIQLIKFLSSYVNEPASVYYLCGP